MGFEVLLEQRLLQCVSPSHGRVLIYVWAIEQDELSKRNVPNELPLEEALNEGRRIGQDVFVPWMLSTPKPQNQTNGLSTAATIPPQNTDKEVSAPQVFNRYYHMFAKGELAELVQNAAGDLGLSVGAGPTETQRTMTRMKGVEIVRDGWERSNYYVELRCWQN